MAHQTLFWGCVLAVAVTFPLTLGWIHFTSVEQSARTYETSFVTIPVLEFDVGGPIAWFFFHALDISAVLVLIGVFIFLSRRLKEPGAVATTRGNDHLALAGLFAVSVGIFVLLNVSLQIFLIMAGLEAWITYDEDIAWAAAAACVALAVVSGLLYRYLAGFSPRPRPDVRARRVAGHAPDLDAGVGTRDPVDDPGPRTTVNPS